MSETLTEHPPTCLADVLAAHRPRTSHRCECGWEGDYHNVHLHDALIADADAVVSTLIDAGVLVRPTGEYYGRTFRAGFYPSVAGDPASVDVAKMTTDPDAVPLYRVGGAS